MNVDVTGDIFSAINKFCLNVCVYETLYCYSRIVIPCTLLLGLLGGCLNQVSNIIMYFGFFFI